MAAGGQREPRRRADRFRLCRPCPLRLGRREAGVQPVRRCPKASLRLRHDDSPHRVREGEARSGSQHLLGREFCCRPRPRPRGVTAEAGQRRDQNPGRSECRAHYLPSAPTGVAEQPPGRRLTRSRAFGLHRCLSLGSSVEAQPRPNPSHCRASFREGRWKPTAGAARPRHRDHSMAIVHPIRGPDRAIPAQAQ